VDGKNFFLDSYYSYTTTRRVPLIAAGLQCTALLCRGRMQLAIACRGHTHKALPRLMDYEVVTGQWPPRCLGGSGRLSGCYARANRGTGADRGTVWALIGVRALIGVQYGR